MSDPQPSTSTLKLKIPLGSRKKPEIPAEAEVDSSSSPPETPCSYNPHVAAGQETEIPSGNLLTDVKSLEIVGSPGEVNVEESSNVQCADSSSDGHNICPSDVQDCKGLIPEHSYRMEKPLKWEPEAVAQKLTIKIPAASVQNQHPKDDTPICSDPAGSGLTDCDTIIANNKPPETYETSDLDEEIPRLMIAFEEPEASTESQKTKILPPKKIQRKRNRSGPETDEDLILKNGTEIDGFIYYPISSKNRNEPKEDTVKANEDATTVNPSPRRPTRQAALNNKLIRGGFLEDLASTDDDFIQETRCKQPKAPRKTPSLSIDDPQTKLAKLKASLAATDAVRSQNKPGKCTAKQRISQKLGLGKR